MGGMTTAATLAKLGRRVLVLEQHYVPGGFTHVFKRPGYSWDVGVHAVGEVTRHSMPGRALHALTDGRLQWASLGPVYDSFHWPDDVHIDFPDNPGQLRQNMVDAFPLEADAIDGYLLKVREVAGAMKGYYMARVLPKRAGAVAERVFAREARRVLGQRSVDVLDELTDNPKLRALFMAQWGYYGSPPARSSFAMQALVVKHFQWGGYYPVGGSARIALELLGTVARAGGWTRIKADVDEILIEGGRAVGVRLGHGEEIRAARVFSAAGVLSTVSRLLPDELDIGWSESIKDLRPAAAHVCLYLGFKGDIRKAGASPANQWFYDTWDADAQEWAITPDQTDLGDAPCLYCSFPSLKDPEHDAGPEQRHTGEVVTFVPWESFQQWTDTRWKRRGEEYDAFKTRIERQMLATFFKNMPQLEGMLDYVELSTPVTTDHFVRPMAGSIYGLEPTPERFKNPWLRPRSPIPGLFFSGSEVTTVGVIGAMMGGLLSAVAAEPVKGVRYLRKV
jgi:all-trans-retinol 13,14-reductase